MEGNHNPSDFFQDMHMSNWDYSSHNQMVEDYVNFLCAEAVLKAMALTDIQMATSEDVTLQCLSDIICNQPHILLLLASHLQNYSSAGKYVTSYLT
jgi:hypothetical protein